MAKLNKSTSTSSKMKASGARYSTTSRSGKQTFYSSSKAAESGKENAIGTSTRESTSVIPMNAMQNTPVANIPPKPVPSDIGAPQLIGENVQNNQYVFDPKKSEAENAVAEANAKDLSAFNMIQKFIGAPQDKEPILAQAEKDAKIRQKEQAVNNYQSELNSIVAKQQQDLLQLRGTGSQQGVTEAVYGGQQAQINREAAIAALPVQAQLSAAQGNLELAQKQVERLFALKSEDIDRQYKYRSDMANAVLNIANESQKRILNVKLSEIQDRKDAEKQKLQFEQQLYLKNLDGGGGNGLTPAQINSTVNSIASAYDNEPIVKEYNTIKRNLDIYNGLGTSATDDIQRVYTFAKVADPNSAVKEGEYDSIEKYSQALLGRAGLKVSRVFTATGILTPEARTAMGKTLQTSLSAAEVGKNQVQAEYQRQIDDAYAGKNRTITEYTPPQPMGPVQPQNTDEIVYDEVVNNKQGYFSRLWGALLGN